MIILKEKNIDGDMLCKHIENQLNLKLPEKGFLAGGAVASAYFEVNGENLNPTYNDIDIFHDFPISDFEKQYLNKGKKRLQHINNTKIVQKHIFFENNSKDYTEQNIRNESLFSILNSKRVDLFNFIGLKAVSTELKIEDLVESFDINCTKIGIDLKTRRLFLSQDFKDFLRFKKLLITDFGLPYHNPIRYLKKLSDLEIESNFDEHVLEVNNYAISIHNLILEKKLTHFLKDDFFVRQTPAFGHKYKELFEKHNKLQEYYYICADMGYGNNNNELFKLIPKKPEKILEDLNFYNNITNEMKIYNKNVFKEIRLLKYLKDHLIRQVTNF